MNHRLRRCFLMLFDIKKLKIAGHQSNKQTFFADILVYCLLKDIRRIFHHAQYLQYTRQNRNLTIIRGTPNYKKWIQLGCVPLEKFPCNFYQRNIDNPLNQLLCAGLHLAKHICTSTSLKGDCRFLVNALEEIITKKPMSSQLFREARTMLNRMSRQYENAVKLIEILYGRTSGFFLGENDRQTTRIPGFFFDMNQLFERAIGKFLKQNLPNHTVTFDHKNEAQIFSGFYEKNKTPILRNNIWWRRPDVIIESPSPHTKRIVIDAKYVHYTPGKEPLEQLAIYALAFSNKPSKSMFIFPQTKSTDSTESADSWQVIFHERTFDHRHHSDFMIATDNALCAVTARPVDMLDFIAHIKNQDRNANEQFALRLIDEASNQ